MKMAAGEDGQAVQGISQDYPCHRTFETCQVSKPQWWSRSISSSMQQKKSDGEAPPQTDWQGNIQETYSYGEGAAKCVINFRW